MKIQLYRWIEVDDGIADEIKILNSAGIIIEACRPTLNGTPANALIRPSSVKKAKWLGYEPEYQKDTGLFLMPLLSDPKPDHDLRALGFKLRLNRLAAKLTQQEVADRAGITRNHLSKIEKGQTDPSWRIIKKLESVLK